MAEKTEIILDDGTGSAFDAALKGPDVLPDYRDLRVITKDAATVGGQTGVLLTFSVDVDGQKKKAQTVIAAKLFVTAAKAVAARMEPARGSEVDERKSLIICGPAGSGKLDLAQQLAFEYGSMLVCPFYQLNTISGRAAALAMEPNVVVVPCTSPDDLASSFIKALVSDNEIMISEKYRVPRLVPAPKFIFTVLSLPVFDSALSARFQIITLEPGG